MVTFEIKTILDARKRGKKKRLKLIMSLTDRILLTLHADVHKFLHPLASHYCCLLVFKCMEGFSDNSSRSKRHITLPEW